MNIRGLSPAPRFGRARAALSRRKPEPHLGLVGVAAIFIGLGLLMLGFSTFVGIETPPSTPEPRSGCNDNGPIIGCAFTVGNPVASRCMAGSTFSTNGCLVGDYIYTLAVESSTITFSVVSFLVVSSNRWPLTVTDQGGFSLLPISGPPSAQYLVPSHFPLGMNPGGWTYAAGISGSTPLTNLYTLIIDLGQTNPAGQGDSLESELLGSYGGSPPAIGLP